METNFIFLQSKGRLSERLSSTVWLEMETEVIPGAGLPFSSARVFRAPMKNSAETAVMRVRGRERRMILDTLISIQHCLLAVSMQLNVVPG